MKPFDATKTFWLQQFDDRFFHERVDSKCNEISMELEKGVLWSSMHYNTLYEYTIFHIDVFYQWHDKAQHHPSK